MAYLDKTKTACDSSRRDQISLGQFVTYVDKIILVLDSLRLI